MTYTVLKPFSCPKPGAVKPKGNVQLQPKDELAPAIGETVDLDHLPKTSIDFLVSEGCIEAAPAISTTTSTTKGDK